MKLKRVQLKQTIIFHHFCVWSAYRRWARLVGGEEAQDDAPTGAI